MSCKYSPQLQPRDPLRSKPLTSLWSPGSGGGCNGPHTHSLSLHCFFPTAEGGKNATWFFNSLQSRGTHPFIPLSLPLIVPQLCHAGRSAPRETAAGSRGAELPSRMPPLVCPVGDRRLPWLPSEAGPEACSLGRDSMKGKSRLWGNGVQGGLHDGPWPGHPLCLHVLLAQLLGLRRAPAPEGRRWLIRAPSPKAGWSPPLGAGSPHHWARRHLFAFGCGAGRPRPGLWWL